jgi:hypothetical protein
MTEFQKFHHLGLAERPVLTAIAGEVPFNLSAARGSGHDTDRPLIVGAFGRDDA